MYLQDDNTIDVISSDMLPYYDLFFGPITPNQKPFIYNGSSLAELLVMLGLAESMSFCRKNGWHRQIEAGYTEIVYGKKRVKVCILKTFHFEN